MAWQYAAAAGISFFGGLMSSNKSAKEMKKMRKLMQKRLDFAKRRYNEFKETYGDIEKLMVADAERGVQGDYAGVTGRAAADVSQSFDRQREAEERRDASYGIDPSSESARARDRQYGLEEATAEAYTVNRARESERNRAEDETYRRRSKMYDFGMRLEDSAARSVMGAQADVAGTHGQAADTYGQLAGNLFSDAGYFGMYGLNRDQPANNDAPPQQPAMGGWGQGNRYDSPQRSPVVVPPDPYSPGSSSYGIPRG